jgi:glycosyltransferase involved in cell wall biosynthesis
VNQDIWYNKSNKNELRTNFGFTGSDYLVGSFQRDTEGSDLRSPKLVKGPDIFIEIVKNLYKKNNKLRVVLTGKRRDYVISELKKNNIPYKYFEMTNFSMMNDLYNILDLYLITSRLEGGPQALVECGQTRTPVISTDVGIAREILGSDSIFDYKNISSFNEASPNVEKAYIESSKLTIPNGMLGYVDMFSRVYEG